MEINKEYEFNNNKMNLLVKFKEKEVDCENIELLDRIFSSEQINLDINLIVDRIRKIFREYTLEYLAIITINPNRTQEVDIKENKIINYKSTKKLSEDITLLFQYDKKLGTRYKLSSPNNLLNSSLKSFNLSRNLQYELSKLQSLTLKSKKDYKQIKLSEEEILLISLYRAFYNEELDFSYQNTIDKIYTMMEILLENNVIKNESYDTTISENKHLFSQKIQNIIDDLSSYGKLDFVKDTEVLLKEEKEKCKTIGDNIKSFLNEKDISLTDIGLIAYIMSNCVQKNIEVEIILNSNYIKCTKEQICEVRKFLNSMKQQQANERKRKLLFFKN